MLIDHRELLINDQHYLKTQYVNLTERTQCHAFLGQILIVQTTCSDITCPSVGVPNQQEPINRSYMFLLLQKYLWLNNSLADCGFSELCFKTLWLIYPGQKVHWTCCFLVPAGNFIIKVSGARMEQRDWEVFASWCPKPCWYTVRYGMYMSGTCTIFSAWHTYAPCVQWGHVGRAIANALSVNAFSRCTCEFRVCYLKTDVHIHEFMRIALSYSVWKFFQTACTTLILKVDVKRKKNTSHYCTLFVCVSLQQIFQRRWIGTLRNESSRRRAAS